MTPRTFPAIDVRWAHPPDDDLVDRLLAEVQDHSPTAVEPRGPDVRIFFATVDARDRAADAVDGFEGVASVARLLVPDEAWAERSQAALTAVEIGRVVISPPWVPPSPRASEPGVHRIVIQPSMGFGTGHHASTRLCLGLLQELPLRATFVLDVGTGSGVLAIAAWRLGAPHVVGIDVDPDALVSAGENIALNEAAGAVHLQMLDLAHAPGFFMHRFDVILANLTGAMLQRNAPELVAHLARRGTLIVSGFQEHEAEMVAGAFAPAGLKVAARRDEDSWVALQFRRA